MPPISTPWTIPAGSRTSTPTSVEVPPTSTDQGSVAPLKYAAPRMLLAGPLPMVSTG